MDLYVIVLRLLHVFLGVFWVGTIFFYALFLFPRVKRAGPLGAQFMQRLSQPPLTDTLSLAAGLVVLSGILLYWRDSRGLQAAWMATGPGMALTIGGIAGIGAASIGIFVSRPMVNRMGALGREIVAAGGQPTPAQLSEMQALSVRLERALYRTAYLLVPSLIAMAVARYL
ncbi:MAG: hypothetical protein QN178_08585 [Armatimonadota bacterium]|nr:hypothetical protein [Armatimonadota bacterium]